jgi:hypothetical protein
VTAAGVEDTQGVAFPRDARGGRSTTSTNRAVWADSVRPVDAELAARIEATASWRSDYLGSVRAVTQVGARSGDAAARVAATGIAAARSRFVFRRGTTEHALEYAASVPPAFAFATETITGIGRGADELVVPYLGEQRSLAAGPRRVVQRRSADLDHLGDEEPPARRRVHGAKYTGIEIFAPETMRTVMTALMVHDLHNPPTEVHPERRSARAAVHGGYWRRPSEIRSTLLYTAALGLPKAYAPVLRVR